MALLRKYSNQTVYIFIGFYFLIFIIAVVLNFVNPSYVPVAFDFGGATTGPMAVPFIMALGLGVSVSRGDSRSEDDSFGLVGVASIGPILAIMISGLFLDKPGESISETMTLWGFIGKYLLEVGIAIMPFCFSFSFLIFSFFIFRKRKLFAF